MIDPRASPFMFDTSAERWFAQFGQTAMDWLSQHRSHHPMHVSALTVIERIRGYALLRSNVLEVQRAAVEEARLGYLTQLEQVRPLDLDIAIVAGELMALIPHPPTPPKRTHRRVEPRLDRLARWRFDCMIASTALVARMPLIHNNAADFEAIQIAISRSPHRFPGLSPLQPIGVSTLL